MSEIISHVLEPVVKTVAGGMEQESSSDMMALMNEINNENHEIEEVDLESVDRELEDQERRADERYNNFDLPEGWKHQTEIPLPDGLKVQAETLPEEWEHDQDICEGEEGVTAQTGSKSNNVLEGDTENVIETDEYDGQNLVSKVNTIDKTYEKSSNATKKTHKTENNIKNIKPQNNPNSKNKIVGHPDGISWLI